jgi:hypothetical protein
MIGKLAAILSRRGPFRLAAAAFGLTLLAGSAPGAVVTLKPVADTTLIEAAPDNNLGAAPFVNAGTTGLGTRNRGLFRFDPAPEIPRGSRILSAQLVIEVTFEPRSDAAGSAFALHRVLRDWGEGAQPSGAGSPGLGSPAALHEATWRERFALSDRAWTAPGGEPDEDYVREKSAEEFIYGVDDSPYAFGPADTLTSDVQNWLDHPETNFGWILISQSEEVRYTARRFGSREDPLDAPQLVIEFIPPPALSITRLENGELRLRFTVEPEILYRLESSATLFPASWMTLTNILVPAATETVFSESASQMQRFYQVVVP